MRDCSTVLKQDDKVSKAYYRSAQALLSLDRVEEALDCCDRCLAFDPDNQGINTVRERAVKRKESREKQERERQERLRKEREEKLAMQAAFRVRTVTVGSNDIYFLECANYVARNVTSLIFPSRTGPRTHISRALTLKIHRIKFSSFRCFSCTHSMRSLT